MLYVDRVIDCRFTCPLLSTLRPNIININTHIMSAHWLVIFFDVLAGHVMDYALAHGDCEHSSAILGSCIKEIQKSPLLEEHEVELPSNLRLVGHSGILCCLTLSHFW